MSIVVVSGALANKPFNGGEAWVRLSYVLGFRALGFEVYFVEQIQPESCVDAMGKPALFESSSNLSYFKKITEEFGLSGRSSLLCGTGERSYGLSLAELADLATNASLLVNISGHLSIESVKARFRHKAFIDLDPGFTQLWHAAGNPAVRIQGHDCYFSVGENIGEVDCLIPATGIKWHPTRPPVILDSWPASPAGDPGRFTTIANWRGPYGPVFLNGRTLGSKVYQFRKYAAVPTQASGSFEIALAIHPDDGADLELLRRNAWRVVDPRVRVPDPTTFREYIRSSGAEFSVAQEMYVTTRSGWFSDRSARYLAAGKPVLVEDTGFSRNYAVGRGLLGFSTVTEAIAGANDIIRNYSQHAAAARQIAEEFFDSDAVLTRLLDDAGVCK